MTTYLTTRDLAEYLRCSVSKIKELRKARLLPPAIMIGGTPTWRADEVDAFLDANAREPI